MSRKQQSKDWRRLAEYVRTRRAELRMSSQGQLAKKAGISLTTVSLIETAGRDSYQDGKLRALENALEWGSGSVAAILAGGEPTIRTSLSADVEAFSTQPLSESDRRLIMQAESSEVASLDAIRSRLVAVIHEAGTALSIIERLEDAKS